jgi:hypothetical protein
MRHLSIGNERFPQPPEPSGRQYRDARPPGILGALGLTRQAAASTAPLIHADLYYPAVPVFGIDDYSTSGPRGPFYWDPAAFTAVNFPLVTADTAITTTNQCGPGWCIPVSASDIISANYGPTTPYTFDTMRVTFGGALSAVSPHMPFLANVTFNTAAEPGIYDYQITGTLTRQTWVIYFFVPAYSANKVLLRPITFALDMDVTIQIPGLDAAGAAFATARLCSLQQDFVKQELAPALPLLRHP